MIADPGSLSTENLSGLSQLPRTRSSQSAPISLRLLHSRAHDGLLQDLIGFCQAIHPLEDDRPCSTASCLLHPMPTSRAWKCLLQVIECLSILTNATYTSRCSSG